MTYTAVITYMTRTTVSTDWIEHAAITRNISETQTLADLMKQATRLVKNLTYGNNKTVVQSITIAPDH